MAAAGVCMPAVSPPYTQPVTASACLWHTVVMTDSSSSIPKTLSPQWNEQGLIPAITQDADTGEVLMLAWMNAEALEKTLTSKQVVYWSRSRRALWRKGETSGNTQDLVDAHLDCDGDTLLLRVKQHGAGACHTGRRTCFFYAPGETGWQLTEDG